MIITRLFGELQMQINWKPGKTESLLQYRGKNASAHLDRRRFNGKLMVQVPNAQCGYFVQTLRMRASSAMQAFSSLAVKVFSSPEIPAGMSLRFMQSLVLIRLLFDAPVVVPSAAFLNVLNAVYMRVLRTITGDMRFSEDTVFDIEVRSKLGMPSIDCVLQVPAPGIDSSA